ncbi:MAG: gluconokinase [Verrucomicrobiota bacterium]
MDSLLILSIDIGTSSCRSALFDAHANRLAGTTAQQGYPLLTDAEGAAELDPAVLLRAVTQCMAETMAAYRLDTTLRGQSIGGVGVSCFWHSLIGCDAQGQPLTRIITWADARPREESAALRSQVDEREVHAATGCMLRASYWPAKLAWLRRTQEKLFHRVAQWMSPAEWLQLQLCGDANCALGMATGTGLFDPTRLAWSPEMLVRCQMGDQQLRPLSDEPSFCGGALVRELPELNGVPWFPGIGDGAASNLGSGATRPGLAAINVGTSAAFRVMREGKEARAPFGLFCYRVDARRYLVGGAVSNAGNLRGWALRELQLPDEAAIEAHLAQRPGPAEGLTVLPFWTAERAPVWNEDERGAIHGLTQHTSAMELLQALTEATYHRIALIAEMILASETTPPEIIVSGGIQKSPSSLQRLADVLGHALHPNDEPEASIRGAAIFALEKLGLAIPPAPLTTPVFAREEWTWLYARERQRQRTLEELLRQSGL